MKKNRYLNLSAFVILFTLYSCDKVEVSSKEGNDVKNVDYNVKEISTGANTHGVNGITIGADGNLYIASFLAKEILVMNKQNGKIVNRIGFDKGVKSPDDLVFGPDGSLYWTDILLGEVVRRTPAGVTSRQFVASGVNPITFSKDGRLFVARDFTSGDGLYEVDPNLLNPPRALIASTPANLFPLGWMNSFDFGSDGRLYGPLFLAGMVVSVDVGAPGAPFSSSPWTDGTISVLATGFKWPVAAKFNPAGILHVLDQTGEVFKIDTKTGAKSLFITLQEGLDNLVFDADGTMYVSNADFGWITEVKPGGQTRVISKGGMISPMGVAVLPGSNSQDALFVGDLFRLRELDGNNGKEMSVEKGHLLPEPKKLTTPFSVSADGNKLVVSSWFNSLVQVWDPATKTVIQEYSMPVPINAIRFKNDLVVVDLGLGGVVRASDKSMILPINNTTVFAPGGLATNGELLWVADWGTGTIWQISFIGNTPNAPVAVANGLMKPEGLALDQDGSLLVVETGASRLSRVNLSTGEIKPIAEGLKLGQPALDGFPPTWTFDGVAVGKSGKIYVSGFEKNIIYSITKK
jgi:sugar lactone lactonase YvrE